MSPEQIMQQAAERAQNQQLPYAGALLPKEAYAYLIQNPQACLVDVRTQAEWDWVGRPHIADGQLLCIEWNRYPGGAPNPGFLDQLAQGAQTESPLLFICRSGARSHNAAIRATQAGYKYCFNVLEGFEGDKDASSHRGHINGWRKGGLPWVQG